MISILSLDNLMLYDIVQIRFERKKGVMCDIVNLQRSIHNKMLNLRRLARFLGEEDFARAYNNAPDKTEVLLYIEAGDKERTVQWTKKQLKDCIETYGFGELRKLAQDLGIKGYLYLTRDMLLSEIFQKRKSNGTQTADCPVTRSDEETHARSGN